MHDASRRWGLKALLLPLAGGQGVCAATPSPAAPAAAPSAAQTTLLVGYAAGGSVDLVARTLAPPLGMAMGHDVAVVNIAGASGAIAAAQLALAEPDGRTLMIGTPSEVGLSHLLRRHFRFDPLRDTTPIAHIGRQPLAWVTSATATPRTVEEWRRLAARSGRLLQYGTSGVGTPLHLAGETIRLRTGLPMQHVPYRGAGQVLQDLLSGRLDMAVLVLSSVLPAWKAGQLHPLGLTQAAPVPAATGIPALGTQPGLELLADLDLAIWFGLIGPPRLAPVRVAEWARSVRGAAALPNIRQRLVDAGVTLETHDDFAAFLAAEVARYRKLVDAAGLRP